VPITVFDAKGIPAIHRQSIEAAVEAAGAHLSPPHEAWIAADPMRGGSKSLLPAPMAWNAPFLLD